MASGEAPQTSIDASSPSSPSSSPPSSTPDPSDDTAPRLKSPWSEIVRGSPNPVRSKPSEPLSCKPQPEGQNERHHHRHVSSELHSRVAGKASPISASAAVVSPTVNPQEQRERRHQQHLQQLSSEANASCTGKTHPPLSSVSVSASPSSAILSPKAKLQEQHLCPDARITESPSFVLSDSIVAAVDASPISSSDSVSSPQVEKRQVVCDMLSEMAITSSDGLISESVLSESKLTQQSPAKSPKLAWGNPALNAGRNSEPEPVMGAVAWPALSEARNTKASEPSKAAASPKAASKSLPSSNDRHHLQVPPLSCSEVGSPHQSTMSHKSFNETMRNGSNSPDSSLMNTAFPSKNAHPADADQLKRSGGKEVRVAAVGESSAVHQRGNAASHVSSSGNTHNFMWDHNMRHHSFPAYGRGHANARDSSVLAQHQRGGHRNLPQPFVPFVSANAGFVHPAGFQNVPGSMYYMPAPSSEPILGATYFVPPGVQGMLMPGPDPIALQGLVVKQIEYYFSVENLCRDIYLRSKMDEQGFVPVSVIANFNRVRLITPNPFFIIEALRMSNAVEVQGDKVRKKGDWANWLLPTSQQSAGSSVASGAGDQTFRFSTSLRKAEVDHSQFDHSRSGRADYHSNGSDHSIVASQAGKKLESHLVSELNVQGVVQDPLPQGVVQDSLLCQVTGSCEDGKTEGFLVDEEVESKHFTHSCAVESDHSIE